MSFTFPPSPQGFGYQQNGNNPVINMGAADYVFLFESNVDNGGDGKIHVFKRLAAATTWVVQDDANAVYIDVAPYLPNTGNVQHCCWGDPTNTTIFLLVLKQSGSSPTVSLDGWDLFSFSTTTDTWNSAGAIIHSYTNGVGGTTLQYLRGNSGGLSQNAEQAFLTMWTRGPGDYMFLYSGTPQNILGVNYGRLYYSTFDGTTFGASVILPDQTGNAYCGVGGCHDATNGDDHFFGIEYTSAKTLIHWGLHSGSFGTTQVVNTAFPTGIYYTTLLTALGSMCPPAIYTNGASVEKIAIAGEFWNEPFDGNQVLVAFTADVAQDPTWSAAVVNLGSDDTSFNAPSHSDENLFPVMQGITSFPQQSMALAIGADHVLHMYWLVTDDTTFLGHVVGASSSDDGATWGVTANVFDALDLASNDNSMVEVYAWAQAGGGVGLIASQLAESDFSEATQYLGFAAPSPTCSLGSVITGSTVTLTWTTVNNPTSATIDQGIGPVDPTGGSLVIPLPGGATTYHLTVSNDSGSSNCQTTVTPPAPPVVGGCRTILMLWQGSFVSKPEVSKDRFGDWDDGGTNHLKFYQGFRMKADTFGVAKSILVRDADAFTLHNIQPATVQHSGEVTHAYSFDTPFYAHQVRDEPQDLVAWRRFGIEWVFELAPENVRTWQTQRTAHGITGYQHISRIEAAWSATADVTLTISSFDGQSPGPLTLASTGGVKQKILLTLTPNKGTLYSYRAISSAPFQLWLGDWVIWVGAWDRQGPYMAYRNLGGEFGDAASI
jgi:hypothetical protein